MTEIFYSLKSSNLLKKYEWNGKRKSPHSFEILNKSFQIHPEKGPNFKILNSKPLLSSQEKKVRSDKSISWVYKKSPKSGKINVLGSLLSIKQTPLTHVLVSSSISAKDNLWITKVPLPQKFNPSKYAINYLFFFREI